MSATHSRVVARWVLSLVAAVLVAACGGSAATSTPGAATSTSSTSSSSTTTTPSPTATTPAPVPMTAEELAWLAAIAKLHQNMDKAFRKEGSVTLTPNLLRSWAKTMLSCSQELARIGPPSARLQPVGALAQQACKIFATGAACYAAVVPVLDSPSQSARKLVDEKLNCGTNAQGDGSNLLGEAEAKGKEIQLASG
jgi:hypothetical protein